MTRAVTIVPCGHTFNEDTVIQFLAHNKLCPIDRQPIERYIPNYTVRHLAEIADSMPQEENYDTEMKGTFLENTRKKQEEQETKAFFDKEAYMEHLLRLLEEPAVRSNHSLSELLEKEVEQLMHQEDSELNVTSIEKYKWTKKLLIDQKVSAFVVKKLHQLSLSSSEASLPHIITHSSPVHEMAFGKAKWQKYFGDIGLEPPLPPNINQILKNPCPFWSGRRVEETHLLVLIPNVVNKKPFTLNILEKLIQKPKTGNKTQYRYYSNYVKKELGKKSESSHWILMTRDVIPDSRNKTYDDQKALVASHAKKSGIAYELPMALEATTAILMHYVETGKALYTDHQLGSQLTYTICQEKVYNNQWPVAIGGFSSGGLSVDYDNYHWGSAYDFGVGCCRLV